MTVEFTVIKYYGEGATMAIEGDGERPKRFPKPSGQSELQSRIAELGQRHPDTGKPAKPAPYSDIDLARWREYEDIITDSLWLLGRRDASSVHTGEYWGNFVPQIPNQVIRRFTRKADFVIDGFVGLGTTLIECKRLGRNGIGVELVPDIAARAESLVEQADNPYNVQTEVICDDSTSGETAQKVARLLPKGQAQLLILHPPYHNIIKFSDLPQDLSNAPSELAFLELFRESLENFTPLLAPRRHLVLVIGDYYTGGEWRPLGFRTMEEVLKGPFVLKSICVKDIQGNRGKRNQEHLWRYRALRHGFYIFKHEYIMLFHKES